MEIFAGTGIDMQLMRKKFKESLLIGAFSFLFPFVGLVLYTSVLPIGLLRHH